MTSIDSHHNLYKSVYLHFPKSCTKPYEMSINDAKQSDFIAVQLEYFVNDADNIENNDYDYYEVIVPDSLYNNVRQIDLDKFIDLWLGKSSLFEHHIEDEHKYNYKSIAKLTGSLCMKKELKFVEILDDYYRS